MKIFPLSKVADAMAGKAVIAAEVMIAAKKAVKAAKGLSSSPFAASQCAFRSWLSQAKRTLPIIFLVKFELFIFI